ncbi:helix-turn-helix domain-containing protein [Streptomyces sp. NPDC012616]|uniref:helix-turn-helix domain-containing protein n=1 Tax=Streptomyces sp. NPDC012616 TaxID=3364840 RepID=UPI0036E8F1A4
MRWELRRRAAERGMGTSAEVRRRLAAAGLYVSVGKMSALWSTTPVSVRLDDLEAMCAVLGCEPSDLLVRDTAAPAPVAVVAPPGMRCAGPVPGAAAPEPGRLRRLAPPL